MVHVALLLLMLEAANANLVSTISLKRNTPTLQLSTTWPADYPIFLEHRIGDQRIIRLIPQWLKAGVLEDGGVPVSEVGRGQGSVISPLLANIYLFHVLDLFAERWRRREAAGENQMVDCGAGEKWRRFTTHPCIVP